MYGEVGCEIALVLEIADGCAYNFRARSITSTWYGRMGSLRSSHGGLQAPECASKGRYVPVIIALPNSIQQIKTEFISTNTCSLWGGGKLYGRTAMKGRCLQTRFDVIHLGAYSRFRLRVL